MSAARDFGDASIEAGLVETEGAVSDGGMLDMLEICIRLTLDLSESKSILLLQLSQFPSSVMLRYL